ncbi:integrase [Streptomyces sp. CO7]
MRITVYAHVVQDTRRAAISCMHRLLKRRPARE